MARLPGLFPLLRYEDPAAAIGWLVATLGFEKHFVAEEGGRIVHAQLRMGDQLLFLGPDHADDPYGLHSPKQLNGTNQCVCIGVEEVEAVAARVRTSTGAMLTEPKDTPWGAREFSCRDPEGHVWSIANYWGEPASNEGQQS